MTALTCDADQLSARVFHGLKSVLTAQDTLPPRFLEYTICQSFSLQHVGDGNFYADGIGNNTQASIKTRTVMPQIRVRKPSRTFVTDPAIFLGPQYNEKQQRWTGGLEIVQRRQALPFDDIAAPPEQVGTATLQAFEDNVRESATRYSVAYSEEIICAHGYTADWKSYCLSLYWQPYQYHDATKLTWRREGSGVSGYVTLDGGLHRVVERVNGNAKREATCFKEFKNLLKYSNSLTVQVPVPDPWAFDQTQILAEIRYLKETQNESVLQQ